MHNTMLNQPIHIHITGHKRVGKTTAAYHIARLLASLGYDVTRTENRKPISPSRRRLFGRCQHPVGEPRLVVVNDQWEPDCSELERWRSLPAKVEALISRTSIALNKRRAFEEALIEVLDLIDEIRRASIAEKSQPPIV